MQIKAIKNLLDKYSIEELKQKEEQLLEGETLSFEDVEGEDEGEQLTHLTGAIWCIDQAEKNGTKPQSEVRNFISRVRNSIS
ncbi:MAG: hypothetical protein JXQ87_02060 [Bacteroidia bacterium]